MADYDLQYQDTYIDALLATANELKTAGYIYKGVATPSTNPGTPTERVAYLASEPGTYTNFGGIVITSGLYSLTYASGTWTGTQMQTGSDEETIEGYNLPLAVSANGAINSSGNWNIQSTNRTHWQIPINVGDVVKITASASYTAAAAWLTSDAAAVHGQPAPISTIDSTIYSIPIGETFEITAPSDAKYLYIMYMYGGADRTPSVLQRVLSLKELLVGNDGLKKTTLTNYAILTASYPTLTASNKYLLTDYIPVSEGDALYIPQLYATAGAVVISGYSSQSQSSNVWSLRVRGKGIVHDYGIVIPSGVNYVRICASYTSPNASLSFFQYPATSGAAFAELARQIWAEEMQEARNTELDAFRPIDIRFPSIQPRKGCVIFQMDCNAKFFANSATYTALLKQYGVDYSTFMCLDTTFADNINYIKDLANAGNEIGIHGTGIHTGDYNETLQTYFANFIAQGLRWEGYVELSTNISEAELAIARKYFAWIVKNGGDYSALDNDYLSALQGINELPTELKRLGIELLHTQATAENKSTLIAHANAAIDAAVNLGMVLVIYGHTFAVTSGTNYTIYADVLEPILAHLKTYIDGRRVIVGNTSPLLNYYYTQRING